MAALKLGRLPNDATRRRIRLRAMTMPAAAVVPDSVDWHSNVPANSWGMDGNDTVGDCTLAEVDHTLKATQVAAGNPEVRSTTPEVLAAYSAVTGYDPADPSTDQGAEMQQVRAYWRKTGVTLGGRAHTVVLFAEIDHTNPSLVKWALANFGPLGIGFACPASALDQFDAGQPWTVVKGSPNEGGHAVSLVGYDSDWWYVLSWGRVQRMANAFFYGYVEEAWTQLDEEWVNGASGQDPLAGTLHDLGAQFEQATGQANPFPEPVPIPEPTPDPPDPDATFAAALHPWVATRHTGANARTATAAKSWLAAKGL